MGLMEIDHMARLVTKTREQQLDEEVKRLRRALLAASAPVPNYWHPNPVRRAALLHEEFERRAGNARRAYDDAPLMKAVAG